MVSMKLLLKLSMRIGKNQINIYYMISDIKKCNVLIQKKQLVFAVVADLFIDEVQKKRKGKNSNQLFILAYSVESKN